MRAGANLSKTHNLTGSDRSGKESCDPERPLAGELAELKVISQQNTSDPYLIRHIRELCAATHLMCCVQVKGYLFSTFPLPLVHFSPLVGSSNTSKYFGSIDSLEHDPKRKGKLRSEGGSESSKSQNKASVQGEGEHFIRYVLQKPLWLLMANADDEVMMTYQMPPRWVTDTSSVLCFLHS